MAKAARVYAKRLREEVNEERAKLGKPPVEEEDDDGHGGGGTTEQVVSTTDPECGMYHKGEHEKQFAYEAHTVCDRHGMVLGVKVTAGNVHDSVAWDEVYEQTARRFPEIQYVTMDAGQAAMDREAYFRRRPAPPSFRTPALTAHAGKGLCHGTFPMRKKTTG